MKKKYYRTIKPVIRNYNEVHYLILHVRVKKYFLLHFLINLRIGINKKGPLFASGQIAMKKIVELNSTARIYKFIVCEHNNLFNSFRKTAGKQHKKTHS